MPCLATQVISQSLGTFEVLGCGTEILPLVRSLEQVPSSASLQCHLCTSPQLTFELQGTRHASRSLYENFLPRLANFIVQGCGDMELAQAISSPSQVSHVYAYMLPKLSCVVLGSQWHLLCKITSCPCMNLPQFIAYLLPSASHYHISLFANNVCSQ